MNFLMTLSVISIMISIPLIAYHGIWIYRFFRREKTSLSDRLDKVVDRQRLLVVRFNELLRVLGQRMASRKAFEVYLVDEDF